MYEILEIKLGMLNAFLIKGESHILVDAGLPNTYGKFIDFFNQNNIDLKDISLIVISHNHLDHVGELEKLQKLTGAKVAIHNKELRFLLEGKSTSVNPVTLKAKLLFKLMRKPASVRFKPHIELPFVAKDINENKSSLPLLVKEGAKIFYTSHGSVCNGKAVLELISHNE